MNQDSSAFPLADQPARGPGVGTVRELITPGDEVPARRVQKRASIGLDGQPMVEIDTAGSLVYVGGNWEALVGFTKPGPAALDALIDGVVGVPSDQVRESIRVAMEQRTSSVWDHDALPSFPFLKVLAIPSATQGGVMHALVGLSASATIESDVEPLSMARHRVEG